MKMNVKSKKTERKLNEETKKALTERIKRISKRLNKKKLYCASLDIQFA